MSNNRQPNSNRRRGRSNNRSNNNRSGFDSQNRIDNRARGNASQMLDKYKKLAADALHNDDRVNAEYYHQFADHYFRVLADYRSRQEAKQEDRRPQRDDNRDNDNRDGENRDRENDSENSNEQSADTGTDGGENRQSGEEGGKEEQSSRPPRRARKPRAPRKVDDEQTGLDLAVLPPAISSSEETVAVEKPARKPRSRKPRPATDDDGVATAAE